MVAYRCSQAVGYAIATIACCVTSGVGCAHHNAAHQGGSLFSIKTPTRKDCSVTPWTIADKKGFLSREGIRLEYTGETQPALQIPSILRGDNDVSAFHPNTLAVARAGGANITGVAEGGLEPTDPAKDPRFRHMWWFINPERHPDIHSFADLARIPGKIRIATITTNICADFESKLLADKYGIPRSRFEWVTMPDIQAIQVLKQGLVDVSEVHPPFYKGMADAGARKIADSFETGLGASAGLSYYVFRDDFIKQHPDKVAAFARAMRKAQEWANAHPEESVKLTEEAIGVPVTGNHYYSENTKLDEALAVPWIDDLEKSGVIPKGKVTPGTLLTHDIEKLNAKLE
jgi:ABC-type nitrate/sulfonate/bicarbonate transport system substrate-binding protein